jgi:hypothetical protein
MWKGVLMKTKVYAASLALAACSMVAPADAAESARTGCDIYVGAWEYVTPSSPGRVIITKLTGSKYLAVWITTPAASTGAPEETASNAGAWEATCEGSRLRWRVLFSTSRAEIGKEYVQEGQLEGDTMQFWTVLPDGGRSNMGAGRRLK